MCKKLLVSILGVILLFQYCHGDILSTDVGTNDNLIETLLKGVDFIAEESIVFGRLILNNALADKMIWKLTSPLLEKYVVNMTQLLERCNQYTPKSSRLELFKLVDDFGEFLLQVNTTNVEKPAPEQRAIDLILKKYGSTQLIQELQEETGVFTKSLETAMRLYIDNLTLEEQEKERVLLNWFEGYKNKTDLLERMALIINLLGIFEHELRKMN